MLEALPPLQPRVIFTMAHDAFAVNAFEVNALDYLLKPVHPKWLTDALDRVRATLAPGGDAVVSQPGPPSAALRIDGSVFVKEGDRCWFVPLQSLRLLEAEGKVKAVGLPARGPGICATGKIFHHHPVR